jgi:hypothetical protein
MNVAFHLQVIVSKVLIIVFLIFIFPNEDSLCIYRKLLPNDFCINILTYVTLTCTIKFNKLISKHYYLLVNLK